MYCTDDVNRLGFRLRTLQPPWNWNDVALARPLFMTFLGAAIITFAYGAIGSWGRPNGVDMKAIYCNILYTSTCLKYEGTTIVIKYLS